MELANTIIIAYDFSVNKTEKTKVDVDGKQIAEIVQGGRIDGEVTDCSYVTPGQFLMTNRRRRPVRFFLLADTFFCNQYPLLKNASCNMSSIESLSQAPKCQKYCRKSVIHPLVFWTTELCKVFRTQFRSKIFWTKGYNIRTSFEGIRI